MHVANIERKHPYSLDGKQWTEIMDIMMIKCSKEKLMDREMLDIKLSHIPIFEEVFLLQLYSLSRIPCYFFFN